jgi:hypothetical protein
MTRGEEAIIKGFLMGAYKVVQDAPDAEKKACADSAYDSISRLAQQLKVDNPCKKS